MLKVRNKVFETNSSSTHCFTLDENKNYEMKHFIHPSWDTEFGWQFEEWHTPEEKLAYIIRCFLSSFSWKYNGEEVDSWKDEDFMQNEMIVTILKPFKDRCNYLGFDFSYPTIADLELGYVDHARDYKAEIEDLILEDRDFLNFLFSYDSYISGGNDNGMYF